MMCYLCHGQHWVIRGNQMSPCPECGGLGEIHCCDGLVAQQEGVREPAAQVRLSLACAAGPGFSERGPAAAARR